MAKRVVAMSKGADDALRVLAAQIRLARHAKGWTAADLAARIGVTPTTVTSLESARPGVSVGTVLNAAVVTGVRLFGAEGLELTRMRRRGEENLALIPDRTFRSQNEVDNRQDDLDF